MSTPNLTITATAYLVDSCQNQATVDRLAQQVDAALAAVANSIGVRVETDPLPAPRGLISTLGTAR